MSNQSIILQPKYVGNFQCDGSKCNAKCCRKIWFIDIDRETYKKYQRIKNPDVRRKILSSIEPSNRISGFGIKFSPEGACSLLCEDNFCYVQRNFGEEALSETCKIYPRIVQKIGNYQFRLLSLTCPVAAEQALLSLEGMEIQQMSCEDDTPAWQLAAKFLQPKEVSDDLAAVHIMMGGLAILQNTSYTFEQRLVLLGLFLDRVEDCQQDVETVAGLIDYYNSGEFQQGISGLWDNWQYYPAAHKQFMAGIFKVLEREKKLNSIIPWLASNFDYDEMYNEKYQAINDSLGIVLERYWQHEWLYNVFPFSLQGSLLHNYFAYLISYEICKLMIFRVYDSGKPMDNDGIIKALGYFSTMLDHEYGFVEALVKETEVFEREPLKLMQVLLRLH